MTLRGLFLFRVPKTLGTPNGDPFPLPWARIYQMQT